MLQEPREPAAKTLFVHADRDGTLILGRLEPQPLILMSPPSRSQQRLAGKRGRILACSSTQRRLILGFPASPSRCLGIAGPTLKQAACRASFEILAIHSSCSGQAGELIGRLCKADKAFALSRSSAATLRLRRLFHLKLHLFHVALLL